MERSCQCRRRYVRIDQTGTGIEEEPCYDCICRNCSAPPPRWKTQYVFPWRYSHPPSKLKKVRKARERWEVEFTTQFSWRGSCPILIVLMWNDQDSLWAYISRNPPQGYDESTRATSAFYLKLLGVAPSVDKMRPRIRLSQSPAATEANPSNPREGPPHKGPRLSL